MSGYIKIFWAAAVISFIGSLPPGITNVAAAQIAISDGVVAAFLFAIGSALAEAVYVRIALKASSWLQSNEKLMQRMEAISIIVLLLLAFATLKAAFSSSDGKNFVIESSLPPIVLGFAISAVSPKQALFWLGVTTVMYEKGKLKRTASFYNTFNFGVATGTLGANLLYIFGGFYFAELIKKYEPVMNGVIGAFFLVLAVVKIFQLKNKNKKTTDEIQNG